MDKPRFILDSNVLIAAAIRRSKKLLLPDALIAATALSLNATVISNDSHLRDFQWPGYTARPR
jgi:predicted nucleic acid-binding protein